MNLKNIPGYYYVIFWKNCNNYVKIWANSGPDAIYNVINMFSLKNYEDDIKIAVQESEFAHFINWCRKEEFKLVTIKGNNNEIL